MNIMVELVNTVIKTVGIATWLTLVPWMEYEVGLFPKTAAMDI